MQEKVRYSDQELQEFKDLIHDKLEQARGLYQDLKGTLNHSNDNSTDDTAPSQSSMEDGSDALSREETTKLAERQRKIIVHLENALIRIENKTYGVCRATGKLIPKERLRLVPHATLSVEGKNMQ